MKNWKFYNALFVRVLFIMTLFLCSVVLLYKGFRFNAILVGFFVLVFLFEMYFFVKNQLLFYDKTINSILHNDFSTHFQKEHKQENFNNLYLLYDTLKVQRQEQTSKELIYHSILNSIDTAALILEKENDTWSIFIMNDCFSNLFKVPKVSHWG